MLDNPVLDFEQLPGTAPWWAVDAVVCALGSTLAQAGSREAFRRIDHDYPLTFAGQAHAHGAATLVLGFALEARIGQRQAQGWEFYAALGCLFLTFAFPGFVWRYLRRRR